MTQTHTIATGTEETTRSRSRWPLYGAAAGLLGFAGTIVLDGRTGSSTQVELSHQLFVDLNPFVYRASMIAGYLGSSDKVDRAMCRFARDYAEQIERDHQTLQAAVARGILHAEIGQ